MDPISTAPYTGLNHSGLYATLEPMRTARNAALVEGVL